MQEQRSSRKDSEVNDPIETINEGKEEQSKAIKLFANLGQINSNLDISSTNCIPKEKECAVSPKNNS